MDVNMNDLEVELSDISMSILDLMDQYVACKLNIEQHIKGGCLDLAKSRYIVGNKNISSLQLPTEDSVGVTAQYTVVTENNEDNMECKRYKTHVDVIQRRKSIEGEFYKEPLKWFGVLVPQSLRQAKATFEKCLDILVENVNIQLELHNYMKKHEKLKQHIKKLQNTN